MSNKTIHWQWVTYQDFQQLGVSEDELGSILVTEYVRDCNPQQKILSTDDEIEDFFIWNNINPIHKEGKIDRGHFIGISYHIEKV